MRLFKIIFCDTNKCYLDAALMPSLALACPSGYQGICQFGSYGILQSF